jgi:hypothetical protein
LTDRITIRRASRRRRTLAALVLVAMLSLGPAAADAGVSYKNGQYNGKTTQSTVNSPFNQIQFSVKKRKITLITEPTVAMGLCVSFPVFTIDGNPTHKINGQGKFQFTKTYMGNKFDKITGHFTSTTEIEGFATYHFPQQDLCSEGKTKVRYTASRKGK